MQENAPSPPRYWPPDGAGIGHVGANVYALEIPLLEVPGELVRAHRP
jgi:hypothetical protein